MSDEKRQSQCEFCGKKLKHKPGPGKPKRFCDPSCQQKHWVKLHPRSKVPVY